MQNSLQSYRNAEMYRSWILLAASILALIAVDQITKTIAFALTPAARSAMTAPDWVMGLAWHIHEPNAHSHLLATVAFGLVAVTWLLPIPVFAKVMWAAAALSNHVEMLARPGTVDFLAFKLGDTVWVANVADIYYLAGVVTLAFWMAQRIRTAESWLQPVTA